MAATKQVTVRVPIKLLQEIPEKASFAAYIVEALREKLAREENGALAPQSEALLVEQTPGQKRSKLAGER